MKQLIDSYINWIREGISFRELNEGWHEIVTPFLNHKNDMIELYVKQDGEQILLSDAGNTLGELRLSGLELNKSSKKTDEVNTILRSFGLSLGKSEIFAKTTKANFPQVKHRLIQAILSIDDMFLLSSPRVESFFIEDIAEFFDLNDIISVRDTSFVGKSGLSHKFDFVLPKIRQRRETTIKAINSPRKDKIGNALWMFEDIKTVRPETNNLVIINDENDVPNDFYQALNEYNVPFFSWSNRTQFIENLKVA